jgi:prepilin peptidase CpaA
MTGTFPYAIVPSVAIAVSTFACATDIRTGRIPNWLTLPAICLGIAMHGTLGGRAGIIESLLGLLAGAAVPSILYRSTQGRAIGGGDVKLFAALGALLGPMRGLEVQLGAFGCLALFAIVALAYRGRLVRVLCNTVQLAANPLLPRKHRRPISTDSMTEFRMGPAIAVAVIANSCLAHFHRFVPWLG